MSEKEYCPICKKEHEVVYLTNVRGTIYKCSNCKHYGISETVLYADNDVEKERRLNVIYNFIEHKPTCVKGGRNFDWVFYYDENVMSQSDEEYVNVFPLMQDYPKDVAVRMDQILLNLADDHPMLSDLFTTQSCVEKFRRFYCESKNLEAEVNNVLSMFSDLGYIKWHSEIKTYHNEGSKYSITAKGWEKVSQLRQTNEVSNQGFIAMSFAQETNNIKDCFMKAISDAGYKPMIINAKEHNNYIMPEIFYEIKRSKFVVVDVTFKNYGAYYEAGYALALGKEVIFCCEEKTFNDPNKKPHFDVVQKSMIIWKDEADLITRLKNRITATVN